MRPSQLSFFPALKIKYKLTHGGEKAQGKRKVARPLDAKRPLHVTLRSSFARGEWSMLKPIHHKHISALAQRTASKYKIKIYRFANVGNHLHLMIQSQCHGRLLARVAIAGFLREFSGGVAMIVTGARKGYPFKRSAIEARKGGNAKAERMKRSDEMVTEERLTPYRFWDHLAWSRVVNWGRDFKQLSAYFLKNLFEAGFVICEEEWKDELQRLNMGRMHPA